MSANTATTSTSELIRSAAAADNPAHRYFLLAALASHRTR